MVLPFIVVGVGRILGLTTSVIILSVIIFLLIPLIVYFFKRTPNGNNLIAPNYITLIDPITADVSYNGTVELSTVSNNVSKDESTIPLIFISSNIIKYNGILADSYNTLLVPGIYNVVMTSNSNIRTGDYAIISLTPGSSGVPSSIVIQKKNKNLTKKFTINFTFSLS